MYLRAYTPVWRKAVCDTYQGSTLIAAFCSERDIQLLMAVLRHSRLPKRPEFMRNIIIVKGEDFQNGGKDGRRLLRRPKSCEARRVVVMMINIGWANVSIQHPTFKIQRSTMDRAVPEAPAHHFHELRPRNKP